ncbi:MAG: hypothetical protein QXX68_02005 [Candidatus Pacearchaeota archaeon]
MTLRNDGFEDEKVAFLIKSLPVENKSRDYGTIHGEIRDIGIIVSLPSLVDFNNFLGTWEVADGVGAGRYMRNAVYVLDIDKITLIEGSNKDSMPFGTKKVFDKRTIVFFHQNHSKLLF